MSDLDDINEEFKVETTLYLDSFSDSDVEEVDYEQFFIKAIFFDGIGKFVDIEKKFQLQDEELIGGSEVASWIYDSKSGGYSFGFDACCEILNLSPNYVRLGLQNVISSKQYYHDC